MRLAGIEPMATTKQALATMLMGRDVGLARQRRRPRSLRPPEPPSSSSAESGNSVQALLLTQGDALVSADIADKDCATALLASEAEARRLKGNWAALSVIKNAESPDDILAGIGRFAVVEGKVLSVRQDWGNDLSELRPELDTGLRRDYFKARVAGVRDRWGRDLNYWKIDGFVFEGWVGTARRSAYRHLPGGINCHPFFPAGRFCCCFLKLEFPCSLSMRNHAITEVATGLSTPKAWCF